MFLLINIIGLIVFLGIAVLFFPMAINWDLSCFKPVLAWFFIYFDWGQKAVRGAANGIAW